MKVFQVYGSRMREDAPGLCVYGACAYGSEICCAIRSCQEFICSSRPLLDVYLENNTWICFPWWSVQD